MSWKTFLISIQTNFNSLTTADFAAQTPLRKNNSLKKAQRLYFLYYFPFSTLHVINFEAENCRLPLVFLVSFLDSNKYSVNTRRMILDKAKISMI